MYTFFATDKCLGLPYPAFLMSWRRRIGKEDESLFFNGCENAGLEVQHLGSRVYCIKPGATAKGTTWTSVVLSWETAVQLVLSWMIVDPYSYFNLLPAIPVPYQKSTLVNDKWCGLILVTLAQVFFLCCLVVTSYTPVVYIGGFKLSQELASQTLRIYLCTSICILFKFLSFWMPLPA